MKKYPHHIKNIFLIVLLTIVGSSLFAQTGVYVPSNSKIFFTGDSSAVFSNMIVKGTVGVGKKAVVSFLGESWENLPGSILSDEAGGGSQFSGKAGIVRFAGRGRQWLRGGYDAIQKQGAAFGKLQIDNPDGVFMDRSVTKVGRELEFKKGLLYLNDQILIVGNGTPGLITGYDEKHFIVTGNSPGTGLLIREQIRSLDGKVVFPLGSSPLHYTPAAVQSASLQRQDIYASVFSEVKSRAVSGNLLTEESVNATWEMGSLSGKAIEAIVLLQHEFASEGSEFRKNRDRAFVSQMAHNGWDTVGPPGAPSPGILTTGSAVEGSGINSRWITLTPGKNTYFTKFTKERSRDTTKLYFSGYRTDPKQAEVYWITDPEVDISYFIVLRKLSNENSFTAVDSVTSKNGWGRSKKYLRYSMLDHNEDHAISYYQLISVDVYGHRHFSNIIAISGKAGGNELLLWPNPSGGEFHVGINGYASVKTIVIWNVLGQKIMEEATLERSIITMRLYKPGAYFVGFISHGGQLMETKKLIIRPHDF